MIESSLVEIFRHASSVKFPSVKDPSVLQMPDGSYLMFTTLGRMDNSKWMIGRFTAAHPKGPWQEIEPAEILGIDGPEVCAPAVKIERSGKDIEFTLYTQTACFSENGIIARAKSKDGQIFDNAETVFTRSDVSGNDTIVGLYDVCLSNIQWRDKAYECMTFSAYRRVGCGDIYMSLKDLNDPEKLWAAPRLVLKQENISFHNHPASVNFEWGLEGAKIIQLSENQYMIIGVCFLDKESRYAGTRQRVFWGLAPSPFGPFESLTTPLAPIADLKGFSGENGHPETVEFDDILGILYQERQGNNQPWRLRYAEVLKSELHPS